LADDQIIEEASQCGVPVIALASTDNMKSNVDIVIPMNNKGRRALAIAFWLIARETLREKGELPANGEMSMSIDDFEAN
ncbi:MAG: 30S ribosomal protein S2, partial [Candidatus Bathyarchaeota archaeon]|nr:30S ribosomal protein S2 [Candidatus Bathyarchaeota archaeon]